MSDPLRLFAAAQTRHSLLHPSDDVLFHRSPQVTRKLLDPRWTGDIDFDQALADQVETHEEETQLNKPRSQVRDQGILRFAQCCGFYRSADVDVGTNVVTLRNTPDRAEYLAVEQQHPFVARRDSR